MIRHNKVAYEYSYDRTALFWSETKCSSELEGSYKVASLLLVCCW